MAKTIYAPGLSGKGTDARAAEQLGDKFSPGWCLYWCLTKVFLVPGLGDWDGDGSADAEDFWKACVRDGKVVHARDIKSYDSIPAGVLLMWTGGSSDHGHASFSRPRGRMIGTDLPKRGFIGEVDIERPGKDWGLTFAGYVLVTAHGFTLTRDDTPPPKPADPPKRKYKVKVKAGVQVRDRPSLTGKVLRTYPKGTNVVADKVIVNEGRHWVSRKQTNGKWVYMAREHFDRV